MRRLLRLRPLAAPREVRLHETAASGTGLASLGLRGGPIKIGWKMTAAVSVVSSDRLSSLPMLEVPGCPDIHKLPNATAVVIAEKKTARVRLDANRLASPARHAST